MDPLYPFRHRGGNGLDIVNFADGVNGYIIGLAMLSAAIVQAILIRPSPGSKNHNRSDLTAHGYTHQSKSAQKHGVARRLRNQLKT